MTDDIPPEDQTQFFATVAPGLKVQHYEIVKRIGVGGMGEVFLASDSKLGRKVALKFLPPRFAADEAFKARFVREARAAAALSHPNIITIHEISEWQQQLFIAMEYVEGSALRNLIEAGSISCDMAIGIAIQICRGLANAHRSGIIHRDIKADNILIDANGHAKILDFGLAKAEGDAQLTQTGTAMGTINYMSPEQAQGLAADHRSDIFSVGVLIYQMLTGKLPFARANMPATIYAIVHEEPQPLTALLPGISARAQEAISRSLKKNPDERYQSVDELASDLSGLLGVPGTVAATTQASFAAAASLASMPAAPAVQSLAVLYLRNLGSADDEFLCYGITEDLIVDLSRLSSMRVAPMRSILKYKDSDADLKVIAADLNVNMILDGSIHKAGERIRVSAQLVEVSSTSTLWADRWEESADSLPRIKESLARGISSTLDVKTSVAVAANVGVPVAGDPQAYEFYLRGKYTFNNKQNTSDVGVALGLYRKALALEPALLSARAGIAEILIHNGEYSAAQDELAGAIADAKQRRLPADVSTLLRLQARAYVRQSDWDRAGSSAEEALNVARGMGDLAGEAETLGIQIDICSRRAKFDEALPLFERVVEISRKLDDQRSAAEALKNMGTVHLRKGEYDMARRLYEKSCRMAQQCLDAALKADCIGNIGLTFYHTGKHEDALKCFNQALAIHKEIGDRAKEALWLNNIGLVHEAVGEYQKALDSFEKVAAIDRNLGNRGKYALSHGNSAAMLAILGDYRRTIKYAHESLAIAREIDFPLVSAAASDTLASAHFYRGEYDLAEEYFLEALESAEKNGLALNVAFTLSNLGELHYRLKNYEPSRDYFQRALQAAKKIEQTETEIAATAYLAAIDSLEGSLAGQLPRLESVRARAHEYGDPRYSIMTNRLLAEVLLQEQSDDALRARGQAALQEALSLAEEKQIAHEITWLKELLP